MLWSWERKFQKIFVIINSEKFIVNSTSSIKFIFGVFILIGTILRLINLNWDLGIGFHPDERDNIIIPAFYTDYPNDPKVYTYGSLTIHLYKSFASIISSILNRPSFISVDNLFLVGRMTSVIFSILIIYFGYLLAKKIFSEKVAILSSVFISLNVGLIQAAHFATTETIISLTGLLVVLIAEKIISKPVYYKWYLGGSFILGLSVASKASSLIFVPVFFMAHIISLLKNNFLKRNLYLLLSVFVFFVSFLICTPHFIHSYEKIIDSFFLQKQIASGEVPTFFTAQFVETRPYIFQLLNVFPWILGYPILYLGILGLITELTKFIKYFDKKKFIFLFTFILYFGYTGSLFVKWTRYMVPLIPFFCILTSVFLFFLIDKISRNNFSRKFVYLFLAIVVLFQASYALGFINIYKETDTRIEASLWIFKNIPNNSNLLFEPYEPVTLPLNVLPEKEKSFKINTFDFYSLDSGNSNSEIKLLAKALNQAEYIIISSRRIFSNRMRLASVYPISNKYYSFLFSGGLGFEEIAKFTSYPQIFGVEFPDEMAEETWSVFDHPVVRVYQKVRPLEAEEYEKLLST